ncbi:hypothetical protein SCLARK_001394 [Spiroplasma clarkii]|uniref:Lipoprotein n=1 Tax=Spiroplasma clarkii TaxID=2139 RepID=A0A1Y0L2K4_9MOLU|nr:lipoprotein [Spiroplasma clarkii]ARU91919.1 hypothetical protein SCLARK_001394 [Spiroplasma clarkii]ATX71263.1 hypothetical protein SCLAR_v1c09600 [Spiroplasma clarkii]
MKKLLGILGSTGLLAVSSATVVACGPKNNTVAADDVDMGTITAKLHEAINDIVLNQISKTSTSFSGDGSTGAKGDNFFNIDHLEDIIRTETLDTSLRTTMLDSFKNLLGFGTIVQTAEEQIRNSSDFTLVTSSLQGNIITGASIIADQVKTDEDIAIDENSPYLIARSNHKLEGSQIYRGNFKFNVKIDYNYYNPNTTHAESASQNYQFVYTIINDEQFLAGVQAALTNFQHDSIMDKDFASKILNVTADQIAERPTAFKELVNADYVGNVSFEFLRNWFRHANYAGAPATITNFWRDKYGLNLAEQDVEVDTAEISLKHSWRVFMRDEENIAISDPNDLSNTNTEAGLAANAVWGTDHSDPTTSYTSLRDYVDEIWDKNVTLYQNSLRTFVNKEGIADGFLDDQNSILAGLASINNLKLRDIEEEEGKKGFASDLPTITLYLSYKPTLKDMSNPTLKGDSYKEAFMKNMAWSLKGFQDLYKIDPSKRSSALLGGFNDNALLNSLPESVTNADQLHTLMNTFNMQANQEQVAAVSTFGRDYVLKYFYGLPTNLVQHYFGFDGTTEITFAKDDQGLRFAGSGAVENNNFTYRLNIGYFAFRITGKLDPAKVSTSSYILSV